MTRHPLVQGSIDLGKCVRFSVSRLQLTDGFLQDLLIGRGAEGIIGDNVKGNCLPDDDLPEKHPDRSGRVQACSQEKAVSIFLELRV